MDTCYCSATIMAKKVYTNKGWTDKGLLSMDKEIIIKYG